MKTNLDVYSIQIVSHYLKYKQDFMNIIQVKKLFRYVLDRMRINPIPITENNKNLFQCIDTQQLFNEDDLKLENIKIYQYNYDIDY